MLKPTPALTVTPSQAKDLRKLHETAKNSDYELGSILETMSQFLKNEEVKKNFFIDYPKLKGIPMKQIFNTFLHGFKCEYPEIQVGDVVVSLQDDCDIRFVEAVELSSDGVILLVNGKQDMIYEMPTDWHLFWEEWEILCKLEDRKDHSAPYY